MPSRAPTTVAGAGVPIVAVIGQAPQLARPEGALRLLRGKGARAEGFPLGNVPDCLRFVAGERSRRPLRVLLFEVPEHPELAARALRRIRDRAPLDRVGAIAAVRAERIDRIEARSPFDDFSLYPYTPEDLLARIQRVEWRRRGFGQRHQEARIVVDPSAGGVTLDGRPVPLTQRELDLLCHLLSWRGVPWSREALLSVLGHHARSPRTVDAVVRQLRKKLGAALPLETIRGYGYRLRAPAPDAIAFCRDPVPGAAE